MAPKLIVLLILVSLVASCAQPTPSQLVAPGETATPLRSGTAQPPVAPSPARPPQPLFRRPCLLLARRPQPQLQRPPFLPRHLRRSKALGTRSLNSACPDDVVALIQKAGSFLAAAEWDKGAAELDKAIQLAPGCAFAYAMRGTVEGIKGEQDQAIADFDKAIQLAPDDAYAYVGRGRAYSNKGNKERAITDYDEAIQLDPDNVDAYQERGYSYHAMGDDDRAIADLDKAIQFDHDNVGAVCARGLILKDKGDRDRAIADLKKCLELSKSESAKKTMRQALSELGAP